MRGYPKNLNTKEDIRYVVENFDKSEWAKDLSALVNENSIYMWVAEREAVDADHDTETTRVIEEKDENNNIVKMLFTRRENTTARIYRMFGCSSAIQRKEAVDYINSLLAR